MAEQRISIAVDLAGNLNRRSQQNLQSIRRFSRGSQQSMRQLGRVTRQVGRDFEGLGNRWTGLATGAAGTAALKYTISLEQRMKNLGTQANLTDEQIAKLKQNIFNTAQLDNVKLDPSELIASVEEIVERTGDLDFAKENLQTLAVAMRASNATGMDIGGIAAEFQKMGLSTQEVTEAMDILISQGDAGAFTLQKLAKLGPRIVSSYVGMGRSGVPAIREMGAALQSVMEGTGDPERAATAFEAMLRTLSDPSKVKELEKAGFQIFDPEQLKQGKEQLRPIHELMQEIVVGAQGKKSLINSIFDAEAARAFNAMTAEFLKDGSVDRINDFINAGGDGSVMLEKATRNADTAAAAMNNLLSTLKRFADEELTEPIKALTDALNRLDPETLKDVLKAAGVTAAAIGAGAVGKRIFNKGKQYRDAIKGIGKSDKKSSGGLGDGLMGGVTPVYVVNMPGLGGRKKGRGMRGKRGGLRSRPTHTSRSTLGRRTTTQSLNKAAANVSKSVSSSVGKIVLKKAALRGAIALVPGIGTAIAGLWTAYEVGSAVGEMMGWWGNDQKANKPNPNAHSLGMKQLEAQYQQSIGMQHPAYQNRNAHLSMSEVFEQTMRDKGFKKADDLAEQPKVAVGGKLEISIRSDQPTSITRLDKSHPDFDLDVGTMMVAP